MTNLTLPLINRSSKLKIYHFLHLFQKWLIYEVFKTSVDVYAQVYNLERFIDSCSVVNYF